MRLQRLFQAIDTLRDDIRSDLPRVGSEVRYQGARATVLDVDPEESEYMIQLEMIEALGGWRAGESLRLGAREADEYLRVNS